MLLNLKWTFWVSKKSAWVSKRIFFNNTYWIFLKSCFLWRFSRNCYNYAKRICSFYKLSVDLINAKVPRGITKLTQIFYFNYFSIFWICTNFLDTTKILNRYPDFLDVSNFLRHVQFLFDISKIFPNFIWTFAILFKCIKHFLDVSNFFLNVSQCFLHLSNIHSLIFEYI